MRRLRADGRHTQEIQEVTLSSSALEAKTHVRLGSCLRRGRAGLGDREALECRYLTFASDVWIVLMLSASQELVGHLDRLADKKWEGDARYQLGEGIGADRDCYIRRACRSTIGSLWYGGALDSGYFSRDDGGLNDLLLISRVLIVTDR